MHSKVGPYRGLLGGGIFWQESSFPYTHHWGRGAWGGRPDQEKVTESQGVRK